jgi:nucleoside-diphosphate-sugar epimerase
VVPGTQTPSIEAPRVEPPHVEADPHRLPGSTPFNGAHALVLGGRGFIGRHLVAALHALGVDVHWTTRRAPDVPAEDDARPPGRSHVLDARDFAALAALLDQLQPRVTFNLVGYGVDPAERDERVAEAMNDRFIGTLARAVAAHRDRSWPGLALVHVGSALEYGAAAGDLAASTPPRPTTLYGRTKLAGTLRLERVARELGLQCVTARLFMVYGPGEREGRLLPSLLRAAQSRTPIDLTAGGQRRDFTYVGDAAEGLVRLAACRGARPGEPVNLATGRLTSVEEFVKSAAQVFGIPADRLRFGALPTRAEEMAHAPVSVARLKELLDWTPPTTVGEGLRRTLAAR